jgi:hypothetical protein
MRQAIALSHRDKKTCRLDTPGTLTDNSSLRHDLC